MVGPCQARIVLLSSIFGTSQAITCPTASKCFLWGSLGQQLVKVHKWWSYSTWGWKWKNMLQIYANISRKIQEEARWTETIFVYVDGGCDVWWIFLCLLYDIWIYMVQAELPSKHVTWHFQALRWAWPWKGNWKSTSRPSASVTHKITGPLKHLTFTVVVLRIFCWARIFSTAELSFLSCALGFLVFYFSAQD